VLLVDGGIVDEGLELNGRQVGDREEVAGGGFG
jgi:hypothetical protein